MWPHDCADCIQLWYTIQHRIVLIIFPRILGSHMLEGVLIFPPGISHISRFLYLQDQRHKSRTWCVLIGRSSLSGVFAAAENARHNSRRLLLSHRCQHWCRRHWLARRRQHTVMCRRRISDSRWRLVGRGGSAACQLKPGYRSSWRRYNSN